ncbi:MAG: hypothetical protein NW224_15665 [Leptolyngbyaceae cyanobacterium bins.302]|nr:hypothetical protein [Leptolyngbyaceae cyanobacterium bins.302]
MQFLIAELANEEESTLQTGAHIHSGRPSILTSRRTNWVNS